MPHYTHPLPDAIPSPLLPIAEENLARVRQSATDAGLAWPAEDNFTSQALRFFTCCLFGARFCARYPQLLLSTQAQASLCTTLGLSDYKARVAGALDTSASEAQLMSSLRLVRQQEMIRIAWRDVLGLAEMTETLRNLSELAEAFIDLTLEYCCEQMTPRFGLPRNRAGDVQPLVVLGMGKLGGLELNYSSDIDLIFTYPEAGESDGKKVVDIGDYYRRATQKFVRLLNESTEDGFVFRVDLRLRPFGASGPVAMSFDAMEAYYQTQGREWERYAMIKARVVSGDPTLGEQLFSFLRPFVFRRYLDYSAFESLRDMKARISQQVQRKGMAHNVKLGAGGIREIEFIGQAFQLVRGGKETELQQRGILTILPLLGEKGYLGEEEVAALIVAYDFLRRTENRLQMVQDQQTHTLPDHPDEQIRLAYAMGFADWEPFAAALQAHRDHVQGVFEAIFRVEEEGTDTDPAIDRLALLWSGDLADEDAEAALAEIGYTASSEFYAQLKQLGQAGFYSRLTNTARDRLDRMVPLLLRQAAVTEDPDQTAQRLLVLMRNIAGRSVYVQVLLEHPQSLALLIRLYAQSKWLAAFVSAHPMVIDEILDHRLLQHPPDADDLQREMAQILGRIADETLDVKMDAVRQFKQANVMRVAAADLQGLLPLKDVSNRLTAVAEQVLQAACDLVWAELVQKHGTPRCVVDGVPESPGLAIVGYGKLGGYELGYGSDLDIVFLHNSQGQMQQSDGDKPIDNAIFFARMAQKVMTFLSTMTTAGTLYEIDTRLRPNGQSGMLVSSVQAFASYQNKDAWTWEHQALVRARVTAGDARIRQAFDAVRQSVLGVEREQPRLLDEVVQMRERMRRELSKGSTARFDLKQDRGGIVDIEFMVQYNVLLNAWRVPALLDWTDNIRLLQALADNGFMAHDTAEQLTEIYFQYREHTHKQALQGGAVPVALDAHIEANRAEVIRAWDALMV